MDLLRDTQCPRCKERWTKLRGDEAVCACGCRVSLQCLEATTKGDPVAVKHLEHLATSDQPDLMKTH